MNFKVDENLPVELAELLRQEGYGALTVLEEQLNGVSDADIASDCNREARALITLDTHFADIRSYPPRDYAGLIVLRLKRQDKPYVLDVISRLLPLLANEAPDRHLWIVEDEKVRIRE